MDIIGLGFVVISYFLITSIGIYLTKLKNKTTHGSTSSAENFILADRSLGLFVGISTLVATEVGGAFVNGTAEESYRHGLIWCLAPIGYALSMTLNGLFFVHKLRQNNYVTLIDALQKCYGNTIGALIYLPSCVGDICWTAAVLSSLASSLEILIGVPRSVTVLISVLVAITYTMIGGMNTVAYTDVIQLILIFSGLWFAIPFILSSSNVNLSQASLSDWTGSINSKNFITYLDTFLLIICGGIPWQPYYQRALAVKSDFHVKILSISATIICLIAMIPSVIIGVSAKTINLNLEWMKMLRNDSSIVLPLIIKFNSPRIVWLIVLAAISGAVMSSVDSSLLSGATYLSHNLFNQSSIKKIQLLRISIGILGFLAAILSISSSTIYGLWVLAGDLGFVVVFPQFLAAVHFPNRVNSYGAVVSTLITILLRILIGEPIIGIKALIEFPNYSDGNPMIPVKTFIMIITLINLLIISQLSEKFLKILSKIRSICF